MMSLEKVMGPGLAAPETPAIRRLRWAVIALSLGLVLGLLLIGIVRDCLGPVVTGAIFAVLLPVTVSIGAVYFWLKRRRDDKWLDQLCCAKGNSDE